MDFHSLLPDLQPWVKSIGEAWPASFIKSVPWVFPVIEVAHLLGLAALGGSVLLPNLRLMGVGLTSVSAATIEKTVRPWLWGAILLLVITGLLMSSVLAEKVYNRPVFLVKMLSLAAALLLSLGVTRSLAREEEGTLTTQAKSLSGIALAIWLLAISLFATSYGPAPGGVHLIFAGWLIVMGFGSQKTRIILGSITAIALVVFWTVTGVFFNSIDNYDFVITVDRWTIRLGALLVSGFALWEFAGPRTGAHITPKLARLVGLFTILAWVTVAAGGRWIGLGG